MKLYDIKIVTLDKENKGHWRTIGTVFADDSACLKGANGKQLTFVIDYPQANGIIVKREKKKEGNAAPPPDDNPLPPADDPDQY